MRHRCPPSGDFAHVLTEAPPIHPVVARVAPRLCAGHARRPLLDSLPKPKSMQGDAPYSHRRLYGIRRLKVIRPLLRPMGEVGRTAVVRRHQSTDQNATSHNISVPRAQPPPKLPDTFEYPLTRPQENQLVNSTPTSATITVSLPNFTQSLADHLEEKRKRIEARWKRLGIDVRTIRYPLRKISDEKPSNVEKSPLTLKEESSSPSNETGQLSETEKPSDEMLEKKDESRITETPNTRKSEPLITADKDIQSTSSRRPRIHGPILAVVPIPTDTDAQKLGYGYGTGKQRSLAVDSVASSILPRFVSPFAKPSPVNDYHSRTKPAFKSYKFMKKLSQRPRLRIRRPGEKAVSESSTQDDPNLTPFQNSAKARFGYGSHSRFSVGPVPRRRTIPPTVVSEIPATKSTITSTTTTAVVDTTTPTNVDSNDGGTGDSGAAFGTGPSELPPELAHVGFEVSGNGINLNVVGPATSTPSVTDSQEERPKQRKQPNPEIYKEVETLVIPQNSGLRPVVPPKELLALGGFGPHTRGRNDGSASGTSDIAVPKSEQDSNPDLLIGDSALTPSRGPTGDGYGPPIFPGGAIPPPVPAVGLGGAAAGKSPYVILEPTENPPTTVKPSALLNVLNKADRGFNQAITHFEQESPLETAAIDILEVALGSTKLDSQAKLLGHVDRTIGLDNLQRIQRWANTAGAMDIFKEQMVKFIKNFEPVENVLPTLPPEFDFLLKPSGR
ncbi:hypothetical protein KIN20_017761 [Parelaphostrongylus tenuis]|uniref:Uncharacterized protein n=1 Tax=Parelaphostrongylus tenuis TaxID=148309 RepID=A0AAD5N2V3_PARTN|nr:hypothetical protein KIN20_017761 [Parelaphostrongylus tenuis]